MWNFNKLGRLLEERQIHRGLTVQLGWVWPWKRKEFSSGMRYRVQVKSSAGEVILDTCHSHKVMFSYVISQYEGMRKPFVTLSTQGNEDEVDAWSFTLADMVETYLEAFLKDGRYLVYVPVSEKAAKNFWVNKPVEHFRPLDCCITDLTSYEGDVLALAKKDRMSVV